MRNRWARSRSRLPRSPSSKQAIVASKGNDRTTVIVIDTDPLITTEAGGHWWDVAVPEVSPRDEVNKARKNYVDARAAQRIG